MMNAAGVCRLLAWTDRRERLVGSVVAAGLLFAALNCSWTFASPNQSLDSSWAYVLHAMAGRGRFGSELLFTYGPLGFLIAFGDMVQTYWWRVGFECALLLFVYWMFVLLLWRAAQSPPVSLRHRVALWLSPVAGCYLFLGRDLFPDGAPMLAMVLGGVNLLRLSEPPDRPIRLCIASVLGALALAKGTLLALLMALLVLLFIARMVGRRGSLDALWAALASFLLCWLATGNALADLPEYFRGIAEISFGYSASMQAEGIAQVQTRLLILLLTALLALRFAWANDRGLASQCLTGGFMGIAGLMLAKHATDRFDDSHIYSPASVLFVLTAVAVMLPAVSRWRLRLSTACVILAVLVYGAILQSLSPNLPLFWRGVWMLSGDEFADRLTRQIAMLADFSASRRQQIDASVKARPKLGKGLHVDASWQAQALAWSAASSAP